MQLEGHQINQYRFIRLLRSGGMGEVYLAYDEHLDRQVAVKVIRTDTSRYPDTQAARDAARLFLREMQAIARLDHMNILPVYGSGEKSVNDARFMFMVMPYRRHGSLADWLQKRGTARQLSLQDVERIVKQAANALQHAHNHHIIHQDIKPSNFLIQGEAEHPGQLNLQLADFGVAKLMTTTTWPLNSGMVILFQQLISMRLLSWPMNSLQDILLLLLTITTRCGIYTIMFHLSHRAQSTQSFLKNLMLYFFEPYLKTLMSVIGLLQHSHALSNRPCQTAIALLLTTQ